MTTARPTTRHRTDPAPHPPGDSQSAGGLVLAPGDRLAPSALAFAARSHDGQRRESDGAPFIEHPLEVARLLRGAGCSEMLVAAGLLHDIIEDTGVSSAELRQRFGAPVADLVDSVSDDERVQGYRSRKRALREQVRRAGGDAALLFAADKVSKVRELHGQIVRGKDGQAPGTRERAPGIGLEPRQRLRLEHYELSLEMLERIAPQHALVVQLAGELDSCREAIRG